MPGEGHQTVYGDRLLAGAKILMSMICDCFDLSPVNYLVCGIRHLLHLRSARANCSGAARLMSRGLCSADSRFPGAA